MNIVEASSESHDHYDECDEARHGQLSGMKNRAAERSHHSETWSTESLIVNLIDGLTAIWIEVHYIA